MYESYLSTELEIKQVKSNFDIQSNWRNKDSVIFGQVLCGKWFLSSNSCSVSLLIDIWMAVIWGNG